MNLIGYSVYYHELDLVRSTRREASKFINLAGGSVCLNISLGLKKGATDVKVLCSTSGANLIVCDLHVMKEIILRFTEWREEVLSQQTQLAPNSMFLPCVQEEIPQSQKTSKSQKQGSIKEVSVQKPNAPRGSNTRQ